MDHLFQNNLASSKTNHMIFKILAGNASVYFTDFIGRAACKGSVADTVKGEYYRL